MPKVSVIIPTYNCEIYLPGAIDSILNQSFKDFEIIIVDDGSTDNTQEIVKKYGLQVKYIYQENKGLSAARNAGINASQGEFIAFLDADDIWLPEKLEHQIKFMDSDKVGIVSCNGYISNDKGEILDTFIKKNYPNKYLLLSDLSIKNVVSGGGSTALVLKTCFDVIGLFDENLKSSEDWDMWLRIAQRYDVIFVEKLLVKIRLRKNSMCSPSNAQKMLESGLIVLGKLFQYSKVNVFLQRKAYSYRYYAAAIAYKESRDVQNVRLCIVKSFFHFPFDSFDKSHMSLVLYALVGDKIFCKINKVVTSNVSAAI